MSEQPKPLSAEEQSTHWQGCEHAHHGCALALLEDWQECAANLALALKAAAPVEHRTPDENEALAEFDRLASEATKGVEL